MDLAQAQCQPLLRSRATVLSASHCLPCMPNPSLTKQRGPNTIVTFGMRRTQLLRLEKLMGKDRVEKLFGTQPKFRSYACQTFTYQLIRWLNGANKRRNYERVIRLIANIKRLTEILDTERICIEQSRFDGLNMPKRGYSFREWSTLYDRISGELRRHKVYPALTRLHGDGKWSLDWESNSRTAWMRSTQADLRDQPVTATDAVVEVVRAAADGYIQRIRQCRGCACWFAAALKTQVFHSPKCQRKHYWSSAGWKAHRRIYMRRYRRIKSLPNVR
jgi:hypothetical protein